MSSKVSAVLALICILWLENTNARGVVHVREDEAITQVLKDYDKYAYPGTTEQPIVKVWHGLSLEKMDYVSRCANNKITHSPLDSEKTKLTTVLVKLPLTRGLLINTAKGLWKQAADNIRQIKLNIPEEDYKRTITNMSTNEDRTNMEGSAIPQTTKNTDIEQDETSDEEEMKSILDDRIAISNASKQADTCMEDIQRAKKQFLEKGENREEPTSLTLEYVNHVNSRTEKLRFCAQRALGTFEPVVTCDEETSIVIEEERKKLMKGADIIHERMIPFIQKYNKSIKKLTQENKQSRKIEIDKLRDENWDRCMEYMKNAKTDIHNQYKTQQDENVAINTELRHKLAEVTDRFQSDTRKMKTENWEKYKEEVDKLQQHLTASCNSKIEELNAENSKLRDKINEFNTILLPKLRKDYLQSVNQNEDNAKQQYQEHVQDIKNKYEGTIQELKSENLKLRIFGNRQTEDLETCISTIKELEISNHNLIEINMKLDEREKKRTQQMQQEFENMRISLDELRKENDMLNATVEENVSEKLSLDKKIKELIANNTERSTIHQSVEILQTTNCELREELIENHILMHQAKETLSRSKSLCDISHSPEEIKMRTKIIQRSVRETDEELQQIVEDQADLLYERTGKRHSLQSITQNLENNARFQKEETEKYDPDQGLTEREMSSEYNYGHLSKGLKTRSSQNRVQNTYNIINSRATFHDGCVVKNLEAISATTNSNPSITNE